MSEPTDKERIAELEHRVALLVRISRLNLLPMPDERVKGYCADFQALTRQVEQENPVPLDGPIEFTIDRTILPPYLPDPNPN